MLPQVREQAMQASFDAFDDGDKHWLPIFDEKLEIVHFPPEDRARMVAAAKPMWSEWAALQDGRGLKGSEILQFTQQQVAKFSAQR